MIVVDLLIAFITGAAANQLDRPIARINVMGWELITRYIVGILAGWLSFALLVHQIMPEREKEANLAFVGAFSFTAVGVITSRGVKDLAEVKA